jgi:hypothetical protein
MPAEPILAQELEMAAWLEGHLSAIAAEVLPGAAAVHDTLRLPTGGWCRCSACKGESLDRLSRKQVR